MGEGDHMPTGGHRRKHDPAHAKAIKEGGKKAQEIQKRTTEEHKTVDVPQAEEKLLADLKDIKNNNLEKATK